MRLEMTGTFVGDKVGAWQLAAGEEMYGMPIAMTVASMKVLAKASVIITIGCSRVFRARDRADSYS